MPTLKPATFICFAVLIATIALSGCTLPALRPLEEVTITLEPEKTASIFGVATRDRFGVCAGVPRSGTRLYLWGEFLRQLEDSRYDVQNMAGYQVAVNRGESCHERILNAFQAASYFDLSSLPSMAVTSARLRIDRPFVPRDPPAPPGTRDQCTVMMIGEATESWDAGLHELIPFIPWRTARREGGPHRAGSFTSGLELDVTSTVGAWVREQRPNEGFVITPDMDLVTGFFNATDQRGYLCEMGIGDVELVVTVAVAR